jgi:hypothetical protein
MKDVIVTLITGAHCVETAAKNELRRLTELLMETEDVSEVNSLGEKLELLREFLETADFNALRSSDERLAGIKPGQCIISGEKGMKPFVKEIHDCNGEK